MQKNACEILAQADGLTTYHYKILLLASTKSMTQTQISEKLGIAKQNCNRACKELLNRDFLIIIKEEGRNKFLATNEKIKDVGIKGQMRLKDL